MPSTRPTTPSTSPVRRRTPILALTLMSLLVPLVTVLIGPASTESAAGVTAKPPRSEGYFVTRKVGAWRSLPSGRTCAARIRKSTWEPRPDNAVPNHTMPWPARVHEAFRLRPVAIHGAYPKRWDTWLLQRVSGRFTGRTDEIFQWAACKWGISDNVLRAVAVAESTWYQYEVYPSGRCVSLFGCGDFVEEPDADTQVYCDFVDSRGHDYQADYGPGRCPKTFGITGVMSWQAPSWGKMPQNQNGTFPFNRKSTAFAVDYLASQLRGCYEGWQYWLDTTGTRTYRPGRLWGCVGAWYAGEWRSPAAINYIDNVHRELVARTWLKPGWPRDRPGCSETYGCPRGST